MQREQRIWMCLWLLIVAHWILVAANISAIFVLPFAVQWYIAAPLITLMVQTTFSRAIDCPLTKAENSLRRELGLPEIHGFVGVYFLRPIRRLLGIPKKRHRLAEVLVD